ncbi:MAG TPA: FAD-binding oxidoreductase [Gemmatimonadales bacterium]|nr:FAD-binding oxidoreductase [Gemmatimonadales bacterium]
MPIYVNRKAQEKEARIAAWAATPELARLPAGITPADRAALERALIGTLVHPGEPAYQQDQQNWNPAFHDKPALIAFCEVPADVGHCLAFARRHRVPFSCRAGGHNTAGYCLSNGGLVIDVSRINDVYVDPGARTAVVGAGATFHKVNAILESYGLHVPGGGCPDVGVAGYMQGGGYGFTSRMFGINCDNVLQVRVMLADGTLVTANAAEHVDLFWAVRGGTGNNFGVLLDITYQLYPLHRLWGFGLRWTEAEAPAALHYLQRHFMGTNLSRRLGYQGVLTFVDGKACLLARGMVLGDEKAGRAEIAGMMAVGKPVLEVSRMGTYRELNDSLLNNIPPITPTKGKFRLKEDKFSTYLARVLSKEEWGRVLIQFRRAPMQGCAVGMEIYGGAASTGLRGGNAFIHRDVHMDFFVDTFWYDPKDEPAAQRWLKDFKALMHTLWNGHSYQNYPQRGDANYRWMFWGDAFPTLLAVKKKYDPEGLFRFPMDVSPYPGGSGVKRSSAPAMFPDHP